MLIIFGLRGRREQTESGYYEKIEQPSNNNVMNAYSELLNFFKKVCDEDTDIHTVTQGVFEDVDLAKTNIYPLSHIQIGNATFPALGVVRFDVQIGVFDIRDHVNEISKDKFYRNDNEIDNLNTTLAIINRLWLKFSFGFDENDIAVSEVPTCEQFLETSKNLLDGWVMTCQIEVPNTTISLC